MAPSTPKRPAPDLTSPPPAWTMLTPSDRLTVVTPLPLEEVQHLLATALAGGLTRGGSGIFSNRRTYEGRLDGDALTLRGPFGNRKWTLLTRGLLVATPTGTALRLAMRLDQGYALVLGFFGLIFFGVGRRAPWPGVLRAARLPAPPPARGPRAVRPEGRASTPALPTSPYSY